MFPLFNNIVTRKALLVERGEISYCRQSVEISLFFLTHVVFSTGLGHLCEFIEDCEHTVLATRILHLLGREGPRSQNPSKYIRFIYNRVILENAAVRAGKIIVL